LEDNNSVELTKKRLLEVISKDEVNKMAFTIAQQYQAEAKTALTLAILQDRFGKIEPKVVATVRSVTDDAILVKIVRIANDSETVKQFSNRISRLKKSSLQSKPLEDSSLTTN
jgi:hypothetical protein